MGEREIRIVDTLIGANRFRMQGRVDACLERHGGDVQAATTGTGIGISLGFARDIVSTFDAAERAIEAQTVALRRCRDMIAGLRETDFGCFTVGGSAETMDENEAAIIAEYDSVLKEIGEVIGDDR